MILGHSEKETGRLSEHFKHVCGDPTAWPHVA